MDKEYEEAITNSIAKTFDFIRCGKSNKWFKCKSCGKRLLINYVGKGINEHMIDHAKRYGINT